jgi:hypothetical protein
MRRESKPCYDTGDVLADLGASQWRETLPANLKVTNFIQIRCQDGVGIIHNLLGHGGYVNKLLVVVSGTSDIVKAAYSYDGMFFGLVELEKTNG